MIPGAERETDQAVTTAPPPAASTALPSGWLVLVNVGQPRTIGWRGKLATSTIWKQPVSGRVTVRGVNLAGDDQADRRAHGGPDKALYAYGTSDCAHWRGELDRRLEPGSLGENLTIAGLDLSGAVIGERWQVGSAMVQVSEPRVPCDKLGIRMGDPAFPRRFAVAGRPRAYLRILQEGEVGAGDAVRVVDRPGHGVTVELVARAYHTDHQLAPMLLEIPRAVGGVARPGDQGHHHRCRPASPGRPRLTLHQGARPSGPFGLGRQRGARVRRGARARCRPGRS